MVRFPICAVSSRARDAARMLTEVKPPDQTDQIKFLMFKGLAKATVSITPPTSIFKAVAGSQRRSVARSTGQSVG